MQTKVCYKLYYSAWNEMSHKTLKVAAAKKSFLKYIIDKICFDESFLFRVIIGRYYFLSKFIITQRFGETAMKVFWKKSAFYIRYLHSNTTMLLVLSQYPQQSFYFLNLLIAVLLFQFLNVPHISFSLELLKL